MFLDGAVEYFLLLHGRQFPIHEQIAHLHEITVQCQLFNRIATVQQDAFFAVYVSDCRTAAGCGEKAWIIGKYASLGM